MRGMLSCNRRLRLSNRLSADLSVGHGAAATAAEPFSSSSWATCMIAAGPRSPFLDEWRSPAGTIAACRDRPPRSSQERDQATGAHAQQSASTVMRLPCLPLRQPCAAARARQHMRGSRSSQPVRGGSVPLQGLLTTQRARSVWDGA